MDKEGHIVISMYFLIVVLLLGILPPYLDMKEILALAIGYTIFSSVLNPDIDLKMNKIPILGMFIGHRGITHNYLGILVLSLVLFFGANFTRNYIPIGSLLIFLPPFIMGAAAAWFVHCGVDYLYDRIRGLAWIVVVIPMLYLLLR